MATRTRSGNLHLEVRTSRKNPVGLLRTSARDKATGKIDELRDSYDLQKIVFVGDRGMLTAARRKDLKEIEGTK